MNLNEKLALETRTCPNCKLVIENPFIEKCPRCSKDLIKLNLDCNTCAYKAKCSFTSLYIGSLYKKNKNQKNI